ncbi:MAG: OprD family outer membrane porin [Thiovulaceae bacterium]|nr:OprD family outer membrane porin [Sulfurimonadaceae bacterium]
MLKKMVYFLPFFCLSRISAEESLNLRDFYAKAGVSGELRALYQYNSQYEYLDGKSGTSNTGVLGGKVSLTSGNVYGFDAVLSGYGAFRGFEDKNKVEVDYLNNGRGNADYSLLGESFVRYTKDSDFIQIGRFGLDTPLLNSDDVRMTPDFFEGVHASVKMLDAFILDGGYIDAIAGWENLGDNAKFENIGDAIDLSGNFSGGYHVGKSSIIFAGVTFADEKNLFNFRVYDYLTQKVMNQLYMESSFKADIYELGAQYLRSVSDSRLENFGGNDIIDSTAYGLRGCVNLNKVGFTLAYDEVLKRKNTLFDGGTPDFFGGANDPFFTSMDLLVPNQLGGVKVYKGEISYTPTDDFSLSVAHALFHKGDGYDQSESDLTLKATLYKNIEADMKLSSLNETDSIGNVTTNNRVRALLKMKF